MSYTIDLGFVKDRDGNEHHLEFLSDGFDVYIYKKESADNKENLLSEYDETGLIARLICDLTNKTYPKDYKYRVKSLNRNNTYCEDDFENLEDAEEFYMDLFARGYEVGLFQLGRAVDTWEKLLQGKDPDNG